MIKAYVVQRAREDLDHPTYLFETLPRVGEYIRLFWKGEPNEAFVVTEITHTFFDHTIPPQVTLVVESSADFEALAGPEA